MIGAYVSGAPYTAQEAVEETSRYLMSCRSHREAQNSLHATPALQGLSLAYLRHTWLTNLASNFSRNSRYSRSSGDSASSPTTAFMAWTSLPMA